MFEVKSNEQIIKDLIEQYKIHLQQEKFFKEQYNHLYEKWLTNEENGVLDNQIGSALDMAFDTLNSEKEYVNILARLILEYAIKEECEEKESVSKQ